MYWAQMHSSHIANRDSGCGVWLIERHGRCTRGENLWYPLNGGLVGRQSRSGHSGSQTLDCPLRTPVTVPTARLYIA
jgi:hypothetical protein